jgi:hypothetical protein
MNSDMLHPLFNYDCKSVGWICPDLYVFDLDMKWIAFLHKEHAWAAVSGDWLGPMDGLNCLDQKGHVVAWNPLSRFRVSFMPSRPARPARPVAPEAFAKPVRPARPPRPVTPLVGWSQLSFASWVAQVAR